MVFIGKLEQTLRLPTVQTVSLWLVWMLRKKTAKVPPLVREESVFWSMVFFDFVFLTGNRLFMLILPCHNQLFAFALVFSEKRAISSAKVAKTSFLAFLMVFLVGARALYLSIPAVARMDTKQLETHRVLLHYRKSTTKAVGVLFRTHFV